jgi:hypothetical protein
MWGTVTGGSARNLLGLIMKDLKLRIRTKLCMGTPFECAPRRIDIVRSPNGGYYCEYSKVNETGKRVSAKLELNSTKVEELLSQLSCMSLPVAPEFGMVCDGEDVEVEIFGQSGGIKFNWYGAAPAEWSVLAEIIYKFIKWSGVDGD